MYSFIKERNNNKFNIEPSPFLDSKLYIPRNNILNTGIIYLHGSQGARRQLNNELLNLIKKGYPILTLCYYNCSRNENNREILENVDVELVFRAIEWMKNQKSTQKVILYGFSRGAELALVVASLQQHRVYVDGVIAHSPSDVFNGPWNENWKNSDCWSCHSGACSKEDLKWNDVCGKSVEDVNLILSAWKIFGKSVSSNRRIEIENYNGPLMITVGEKDKLWSVDQTRRIQQTLSNNGKTADIYYYPEEGHIFGKNSEEDRKSKVINFLQKVN